MRNKKLSNLVSEKIVICNNCQGKMKFVHAYDLEDEKKDSEGYMVDIEIIMTMEIYVCDKCENIQFVRKKGDKNAL